MAMRYFAVTCRHGHHGAKRYMPVTFAFLAKDAIKAMDLAKAMPGVKHSAMILKCEEISYAQYIEYRRESAYKRIEKR